MAHSPRPCRALQTFALALLASQWLAQPFSAPHRGRVALRATSLDDDPHRWLEELEGPQVGAWLAAQNARTLRTFGDPASSPLLPRLQLTESTDVDQDPLRKLPQATKIGRFHYEFWSDATWPRGVWRRTSLEGFASQQPEWEVVLSLDALSQEEGERWVWRGYVLEGTGQERAMLQLSRGGGDAFVAREFDLESKAFVPPERGGFLVPEAKSILCYRSRDVLLVSSDFGPGSLTAAGYPRGVRAWRRGSAMAEAELVFQGEAGDHIVYGYAEQERGGKSYEFVLRARSFYEVERYASSDGGWRELKVPADAELMTFGEDFLLRLGAGFGRFPAGALLAAPAAAVLAGREDCWSSIWEPEEEAGEVVPGASRRFSTLRSVTSTKSYLVLVVLERVRSKLVALRREEGRWRKVGGMESSVIASVSARAVDALHSDALWLGWASYTEPPRLYHIPDVGSWLADGSLQQLAAVGMGAFSQTEPCKVKALPQLYNAAGVATEQLEAVSRDGTRVPYFLVRRKGGAAGPVLVYAYGGFAIPVLPAYAAGVGAAWLERGGAYVEAHIRGGGEFGPAWSEVARKGGRQKSYEDLEAVADDLVRRGLASPETLGLLGRSNGGLMVGNMLLRQPARFAALVGEVPLLDMRIYHRLLAGASWLAEYGDPEDSEDWAALQGISPYHLLEAREGKLPAVLFTTSTRDDRVHPCHARKMVEKLRKGGHEEAYLFETREGGHAGATSIAQKAYLKTLEFNFLWRCLTSQDSAL